MDIRNILHKKEENKTKKIRIIIAILFFGCILSLFGILVYRHQHKAEYFLWESVSVEGTIEVHNNYPINTHKLISKDGIFGMKSSSLNLNDFLWEKITVDWNITDITKDFPVLEISSLTIPDKSVKVTNNIYSFAKELIYFDFSQEKEFYASKDKNKITIYFQNSPIIDIESFFCSKITPQHNCEELAQTYETNDNDLFSSYGWNIFYKISDNEWITFNDDILGYIINTVDEDLLLNISHLLNIIDSNFIKNNKRDFIVENCLGEVGEDESVSISSINLDIIDENLLKLDIQLSDSLWNNTSCKINVDVFDNWNIKNITT